MGVYGQFAQKYALASQCVDEKEHFAHKRGFRITMNKRAFKSTDRQQQRYHCVRRWFARSRSRLHCGVRHNGFTRRYSFYIGRMY